MFNWLKKLASSSDTTARPSADPIESQQGQPRETLHVATVWEVVDRFLANNPQPTHLGVHALIDAGAADLIEPTELIQVCEKIQEHGYQYPLNPTLVNELETAEILEFLRWQDQNEAEPEYYANESTIRELIQRFRMGQ